MFGVTSNEVGRRRDRTSGDIVAGYVPALLVPAQDRKGVEFAFIRYPPFSGRPCDAIFATSLWPFTGGRRKC
jgi:hypothetical protein